LRPMTSIASITYKSTPITHNSQAYMNAPR